VISGQQIAGSLLLTGCLVAGCIQRSSAAVIRPTALINNETCPIASSDLANQVLAMDLDHISQADLLILRTTFPVPRIIAINGWIPLVTLDSLVRFFTVMGYPEEQIADPLSGALSYSSHRNSAILAGMVAWYYERDGVMPILIGHSQGGMLVVKVFQELSGSFETEVQVWNPYADRSEGRSTIIDPVNGHERPVIGLKAGFASAIGTGKVMRLILGQWDMLRRLRQIPDSVMEFTGYHIPHDFLSGTLFGVGTGDWYQPMGAAHVRNVILPSGTGHLEAVRIETSGMNQDVRQWISAYQPGQDNQQPLPEKGGGSILYAADIWHQIKASWCREVQNWITGSRRVCEVNGRDR
jgi:hypothetical protein